MVLVPLVMNQKAFPYSYSYKKEAILLLRELVYLLPITTLECISCTSILQYRCDINNEYD